MADSNWTKSSFSSGNGACVEVAPDDTGGVKIRNSNDPDSYTLHFTAREWAAFVAGVKAGEFAPWGGPPTRPYTKWERVAEELKAHPGVPRQVNSSPRYNPMSAVASSINRGRCVGMPAGEFEAKVVRLDPDDPTSHYGLWVHYKGEA
jgi:hypothetical protein